MDALAHCLLPLAGYTKAAKNKKSDLQLLTILRQQQRFDG